MAQKRDRVFTPGAEQGAHVPAFREEQQSKHHDSERDYTRGSGVLALRRKPYNRLTNRLREVIVRFTPLSLVALLLLGVMLPLVSWAEPDQQPQIPSLAEKPPEDEARAKLERDMAKKANQERQAQLKRDTEKLLKLATELKQYVDKSNENVLSLDVVKKAEEIEKLAHSVREKMKNAGGPL
jgi:hypothetical protein